jgi:hypothetical protein
VLSPNALLTLGSKGLCLLVIAGPAASSHCCPVVIVAVDAVEIGGSNFQFRVSGVVQLLDCGLGLTYWPRRQERVASDLQWVEAYPAWAAVKVYPTSVGSVVSNHRKTDATDVDLSACQKDYPYMTWSLRMG